MARAPRPLGSVPKRSALDCMVNGFRVFMDDPTPLVVFGFFMAFIGAIGPIFLFGPYVAQAGGVLFYIFIGFPAEVGFAFLCLRAVRSGGIKTENLFAVITHYGEIVLAGIFTTLLIVGATSFFFLPGVYVYLRTRFVPYLLLEDELDFATAIRESFHLTSGITGQVFVICMMGGALYLIGGLALLLGISPALALWHLALASLYHANVAPPEAWKIEDEEDIAWYTGSDDDLEAAAEDSVKTS